MKKAMAAGMAALIFATGMASGSSPAHAAGFETRFMQTCKADGDDLATCKCHYKKLKKPKTKAEEDLVINVIKGNDAKVEELIAQTGFRSIGIINSMTAGLAACMNASG